MSVLVGHFISSPREREKSRARENQNSFGPRPKFRNWDRFETAKSKKKSVPYWPYTKEIFSDSVGYLGYYQILNLSSSDVNPLITHD